MQFIMIADENGVLKTLSTKGELSPFAQMALNLNDINHILQSQVQKIIIKTWVTFMYQTVP